MAKRPLLQVKGARELRRSLKQAGDDFEDLKAVHKQVADIAARAGIVRAPVGATGRLRNSIRTSGTKTAAVIRAGYKTVPYAGPIHWGWPDRHIEGQFYLNKGARATEPQWVQIYTDYVNAALDKIEGA